jgi:hypothetical protein
MKFPDLWPSGCPPFDAADAEGAAFRIVNNDPPLAEDVASHFETGKLRKAPPCLRCGLSVFREVQDAVHQRRLFPRLGQWIAQAALRSIHGKTKATAGMQPTHTTWWPYDGVNRAMLFAIVRED